MTIGGCGRWIGLGSSRWRAPVRVDVAAVVVEGRLGQQADDRLDAFAEAVEAFTQGRQVDAVGAALLLVPAGADAELEPAVGDHVDAGRHVGQHRRVAVHEAGDQHPDPQPGRGLGQRGQGDPAFEARPGGVTEDRVEVVEQPARLEEVDVVGLLPRGQHGVVGGVLGSSLEGESHRPNLRSITGFRTRSRRRL